MAVLEDAVHLARRGQAAPGHAVLGDRPASARGQRGTTILKQIVSTCYHGDYKRSPETVLKWRQLVR